MQLEEVVTCQKDEIRLRPCWPGCVVSCLERLQYLYNRNATLQTPSSTRTKSTYSAVCASAVPSISPRKGTSDFTGLAVGPASRKRTETWALKKSCWFLRSRGCIVHTPTYTGQASSWLWCWHGSPFLICFYDVCVHTMVLV